MIEDGFLFFRHWIQKCGRSLVFGKYLTLISARFFRVRMKVVRGVTVRVCKKGTGEGVGNGNGDGDAQVLWKSKLSLLCPCRAAEGYSL